MIYYENINNLKKSMNMAEGKKASHKVNRISFLPFKTRATERPRFKYGFSSVAGECTRLINSCTLNKDFDIEIYIKKIIGEVECNDSDRVYLNKLIKNYLLDKNGDINIFHPKILNYIPFTNDNEGVGEKDIANFLYDIFFENFQIKDVFSAENNKNLLIKLILKKIGGLEECNRKCKYVNQLNHISFLAKEDLKFIAKNKDYFVSSFEPLLAYYYFYYITQISFKLNKRFGEDVNYFDVEPFYYLLDWEKPGKNRKSDLKGYKLIKSSYKNLLININILDHINFIFGVTQHNYEQIKNIFNNSSPGIKLNYLETMREWVEIYRDNFLMSKIEIPLEFNQIIEILKDSLLTKMQEETPGTLNRYSLYIEEIGKAYFLKRRGGGYGFMLNLTQEMVLLLTAVSIKEDKITLKALFIEFEKRGIFLDQYSKDLVTELLIKLNLIDKKSDSGDAQYVKSIL